MKATRPGEALLKDEHDGVWRLTWSAAPGGKFAVPAGKYRWVTYRLVEGEWHVSASGELASVEVRGESTASIDARDGIKLMLRGGTARNGAVQAQTHLGGAVGGGLTLYRAGRRVGLTFKVLGEGGEELGSAPVRYG